MRRMSPGESRNHGDQLLSRLLHGEVGGGKLENDLLRELHEGYPVSKLRLLLRAKDEKLVAAGMWIASELGASARPLFADVVSLIHHPFFQVRFFALDCLITCARTEDKEALALGLDLIDDPEPSVRWKAMVFLAGAPESLLRAIQITPSADQQADVAQEGLGLLLNSLASHDSAAVVSGLTSSNPVLRRYAAAAAARMAHRDPGPLKRAAASADPTIKQFALDMAARAGVAVTS